jgi:hypothetical protein
VNVPGRQQRALKRIKKQLLDGDPRLDSMFSFFTQLTLEDPMPPAERIEAGPQRLLGLALAGRRRRLRSHASAPSKAPRT